MRDHSHPKLRYLDIISESGPSSPPNKAAEQADGAWPWNRSLMGSANLLNERPVLMIKFGAVNGGNVSVGYHGDSVWAELSQRMLLGSILG